MLCRVETDLPAGQPLGLMLRMRLLALLLWTLLAGSMCAGAAPEPSRPLVMVHVMPWFEAPPTHPTWGWHWTMGKTQPASGSLATHDRPLIGAYDSSDPRVLAYQVALMKTAGVDGAIIDWNGTGGFADYAMIHANTARLIAALKTAGLRFAICVEDNPGHRFQAELRLPRATATTRLRESFQWLDQHWLTDPAYLRIDGRPLLFLFGPQYLEAKEWSEIRPTLATNPLTLGLPHLSQRPGLDGAFAWIPVSGGQPSAPPTWTAALADVYATARPGRPVVAVAFPGFHDYYAEAGVGPSYGRIDDRAGLTFAESLEQAWRSGAPVVQVATWNDYGEGTVIEPTEGQGHRHLTTLMHRLKPQADPAELTRLTADYLKAIRR